MAARSARGSAPGKWRRVRRFRGGGGKSGGHPGSGGAREGSPQRRNTTTTPAPQAPAPPQQPPPRRPSSRLGSVLRGVVRGVWGGATSAGQLIKCETATFRDKAYLPYPQKWRARVLVAGEWGRGWGGREDAACARCWRGRGRTRSKATAWGARGSATRGCLCAQVVTWSKWVVNGRMNAAACTTCPISTEGWTRRVHFVREGGGLEVVRGQQLVGEADALHL